LSSSPKTIFIDIDGTIFKHPITSSGAGQYKNTTGLFSSDNQPSGLVLQDVHAKFDEWKSKSYCIVLVTARSESMRAMTVRQLENNNLFFDHLIMGLPNGERVLINDTKPNNDGRRTATAFTVCRDKGIGDIEI
jgi:uncharacterized HAD superfamily protein